MERLTEKLKEAQRVFERARSEAYTDFVNRNAEAGKGDVVTDGRGPILVESLAWFTLSGVFGIDYSGKLLRADLTPRKDGKTGYAIQGNGFKVLKKKEL